MPKFNGLALTDQGTDLMLKSLAHGVPTPITRISVGDGELSPDVPFYTMTGLVNEVQTIPQVRKTVIENHVVQLEFGIRTSEIDEGFWFREIGVWAAHPVWGEILYAYENIGSLADFMPSFGGATIVSRTIRIMVHVGNAATVTLEVGGMGTIGVATERHTATEGQTQFEMADLDASAVVSVNIDGSEYFDWSVAGKVITLNDPLPQGQSVWFRELRLIGVTGDDGGGSSGGGSGNPGGGMGDDLYTALLQLIQTHTHPNYETRITALESKVKGVEDLLSAL